MIALQSDSQVAIDPTSHRRIFKIQNLTVLIVSTRVWPGITLKKVITGLMGAFVRWLGRKGRRTWSDPHSGQLSALRPECEVLLTQDHELQIAEHDKFHPGSLCNTFSFRFENPDAPLAKEIVVLVPIHPAIERQYVNSCLYLLQRNAGDFRTCRIVFDSNGEAPPRGRPHPYRQAALAKIRQDMVERYIGAADWVAWVDADIVFYPPDLLRTLVERAARRDPLPPWSLWTEHSRNDWPGRKRIRVWSP